MSYKLYVVPKVSAPNLDSYQLSGEEELKTAFVSAVVGGYISAIIGGIIYDSIPGPAVPG